MTRRRLAVALAASVAIVGVLAYLDHQHSFEMRTETFVFESGGNELAARISLPEGDGPHGIVVFVPGDGAVALDPGALPVWEALARAGYASVRWDKPGVGDSTGNWLDQDMGDRAAEVVDAIEALGSRSDLAVDDLGVIGSSQGGWVLPLVAERVDVDFFVAWSTAIEWQQQGRHLTTRQLDAVGADPQLRARVLAQDQIGDRILDTSYADYLAWHDSLDDDVGRYFERMDEDRWAFAVRNRHLDARDTLDAMAGTPVLLLLGERDVNVDVDDTERVYREILGDSCLDVIRYPDADHELLDHEGIALTIVGVLWPRAVFADGLLEDLERFAADQSRGRYCEGPASTTR